MYAVHFWSDSGVACGSSIVNDHTTDARDVTCKRCQKTVEHREAIAFLEDTAARAQPPIKETCNDCGRELAGYDADNRREDGKMRCGLCERCRSVMNEAPRCIRCAAPVDHAKDLCAGVCQECEAKHQRRIRRRAKAEGVQVICRDVEKRARASVEIPNELAHRLADVAIESKDFTLALEILYRAAGDVIATEDRIINLEDRMTRIVIGDECRICHHATERRLRWRSAPFNECACHVEGITKEDRATLIRLGTRAAITGDQLFPPDTSESGRPAWDVETHNAEDGEREATDCDKCGRPLAYGACPYC